MTFGLQDTSGVNIDTSRVYFTVEVHHAGGGVDTYSVNEPSPYSWFTPPALDVTATVGGFPWTDGDSVWVRLDSFFNEDGCRTIP